MQKIIYQLVFVLGVIFIFAGFLFKIQHYPGFKIMQLVGFGFIGFLFTPIYFSIKLKKHKDKILKIFDFTGIFSLVNISLGVILKIFDYKLGYYISLIGVVALAGLFIPFLIYIIVKNKENRLKRIMVLIISLLYVFLSFFLSTWEHMQIINAFEIIDQALEEQNLSQHNHNQIDYSELIENNAYKDKLFILKQQSDSICSFIQTLKIEIVRTCSENDSMLNKLLFKENKASILKNSIESHKDFINKNLANYIDKENLNKFLSTNISNPDHSDSWEDECFNHLPVEAIITILSMIESNIRNVESEIIENIKEITPANNYYD
ncbi:MAG: hypothetical protein KAT68_10190 [Bacteroidales bacterium]|nr:hypothetical protein [Bacteroidales bacterium]